MQVLLRFLLFAGIALVVGLGTAWLFVDRGLFATTYRAGPWSIWGRAGMADADPYTLAHLARLGSLPMTSTSLLTFSAEHDSSGSSLSGDCTYEIRGRSFPALWWNIAAFKPNGDAIQSKTGRSSFNSNTILTAPDGRFLVRLSSEVQPGNWLPAEKGYSVVIRINILRPLNPDRLLRAAREDLPDIKLLECS